jgi:uncharacterized protein
MSTISAAPSDRVRPFRQFIVKVHGRCNLACDHCYVYEMADQRWRRRPRTMSRATIARTVDRVAEHVRANGLGEVEVILHGGEPLLAGAKAITALVTRMREVVPATVLATVQTNATLLDRTFLDLFRELDVRVGLSLDGDEAANDRHRVLPNGKGTYWEVRAALELLCAEEYRHLFRGVLCTVDLANDPIRTYEALLEFTPPAVDFLLPHGNWTTPPPGMRPGESRYARWLASVFDRWYSAGHRETGVRLFEEIINVLLGGHSRVEGIGLSPPTMVVVETDGAIERADFLAAAFEGAAATGLHVATDSFDDVLRLPETRADQGGFAALCATCRVCALGTVCGGGLRAHRYRAGHGFDNPSVYCADLYALISHVRQALAEDLAAFRQVSG